MGRSIAPGGSGRSVAGFGASAVSAAALRESQQAQVYGKEA